MAQVTEDAVRGEQQTAAPSSEVQTTSPSSYAAAVSRKRAQSAMEASSAAERSESPKSAAKARKRARLAVPKWKAGDLVELWRDGRWQACEVVSVRRGASGQWLYYAHVAGADRRSDGWQSADSLREAREGALDSAKRVALPLSKDNDKDTALIEEIYSEQTAVRNIERVQLGSALMDAWYFAPFPESFGTECAALFVCEFCLKYMRRAERYAVHRRQCALRHPPGDEVYRAARDCVSVFEVDGAEQKVYCQNLCLLAKLFFDHKTLYFDTSHFVFYVVCARTPRRGAFQLTGYFSKEKRSPEQFNLACILALPAHQRRGVGRLIVALSYALSAREGRLGSPEKPLSDLGRLCYQSYWREAVLRALLSLCPADDSSELSVDVDALCKMTAMTRQDTVDTLAQLRMLHSYRGAHLAFCRAERVRELLVYYDRKRELREFNFEPESLQWQPPKKHKK